MGDMDSVSDEALKGCDELVVHTYTDGKAPGLDRINKLGLKAKTIPAPGTSEILPCSLPLKRVRT